MVSRCGRVVTGLTSAWLPGSRTRPGSQLGPNAAGPVLPGDQGNDSPHRASVSRPCPSDTEARLEVTGPVFLSRIRCSPVSSACLGGQRTDADTPGEDQRENRERTERESRAPEERREEDGELRKRDE